MSRAANTIVAEIKTLYGRRREEKLVIQKDMVALRDEHGWTQQEIADATGIPQRTVSNWLEAFDEGLSNPAKASRLTPESVQEASDARVAARVLASAPAEVIERIVGELPRERQNVILGASGSSYRQARAEHEEHERNLSPTQRKERETNRSSVEDFGAKMASPFVAQRIVNNIEQATEDLRELIEHNVITPEISAQVGEALSKLNNEFEVASAMRSLEEAEL